MRERNVGRISRRILKMSPLGWHFLMTYSVSWSSPECKNLRQQCLFDVVCPAHSNDAVCGWGDLTTLPVIKLDERNDFDEKNNAKLILLILVFHPLSDEFRSFFLSLQKTSVREEKNRFNRFFFGGGEWGRIVETLLTDSLSWSKLPYYSSVGGKKRTLSALLLILVPRAHPHTLTHRLSVYHTSPYNAAKPWQRIDMKKINEDD